jgi:hypothetical protein
MLGRRRCHNVVTTRCEFGELTGDGLRRFPLVRQVRESLRDNQIQALPDWGSNGRIVMSCQLDLCQPDLLSPEDHSITASTYT